jgi:hypothetical protein
VEIRHLCYSPVLAPVDFFLLPTRKTALKVKRFQDVEDINKNVMAELKTVPLEASRFKTLFKRCNSSRRRLFW